MWKFIFPYLKCTQVLVPAAPLIEVSHGGYAFQKFYITLEIIVTHLGNNTNDENRNGRTIVVEDRFAKITISFDNGRTFVLNTLPEDVEDFFGNLSAGGKFGWPLNPLADDSDERDFFIDCSKVSFVFVTWPDEEDAVDG